MEPEEEEFGVDEAARRAVEPACMEALWVGLAAMVCRAAPDPEAAEQRLSEEVMRALSIGLDSPTALIAASQARMYATLRRFHAHVEAEERRSRRRRGR